MEDISDRITMLSNRKISLKIYLSHCFVWTYTSTLLNNDFYAFNYAIYAPMIVKETTSLDENVSTLCSGCLRIVFIMLGIWDEHSPNLAAYSRPQ